MTEEAGKISAVAFMTTAMVLSCCVDVLVKALDGAYPLPELLFFRMLFGLIPLVLAATPAPGILVRSVRPQIQLSRCFVSLLALVLWFSALPLIPLAQAVTISLLAPVVAALISSAFLGHASSGRQWFGIAISIIGGILTIQPELGTLSLGLMLVIGATVLRGCTLVIIQELGRDDHPLTTTFYFTMTGLLASGPLTLFNYHQPSSRDFALLFCLGVVAGFSQVLIAMALQRQSTISLAPLDYLRLPLAGLAAFVFFNEALNPSIFAGASLIIAGSALTLVRASR